MSYPRVFATPGVGDFAEKVDDERQRQIRQWGDQRHPDGTGLPGDEYAADLVRQNCERAAAEGRLTWRHIASEEQQEAYAETDLDRLETELIQHAAVIAAWVYDIQRRRAEQYAATRKQVES
jgi:hypothetical protein